MIFVVRTKTETLNIHAAKFAFQTHGQFTFVNLMPETGQKPIASFSMAEIVGVFRQDATTTKDFRHEFTPAISYESFFGLTGISEKKLHELIKQKTLEVENETVIAFNVSDPCTNDLLKSIEAAKECEQ